MEERNYTTIDNEFIKGNKALTTDELSILTIIAMNKTVKNQYIFTIKNILKQLNITSNCTRKTNEIKNTLIQLNKCNVLDYYSSTLENDKTILDINTIDKTDIIHATTNLILQTGFTLIYDDEIHTILENANKYKADTYTLISLFVYICSYINNNEQDENYKLCYVSHETIMNDLDIAENTIIKYIDILKQIHILSCDYSGFKETSKGKIKNDVMYYCRAEDEELLINRLNKVRKEKGILKLNSRSKDKSNCKKSIKQKINILKRKESNNKITNVELITLKLLQQEYNQLIKERKEKE